MKLNATTRLAGLVAVAVTALMIAPTPANAAEPWGCPEGNFCAYSGANGTGQKCVWKGVDPYWTSGEVTCSWSLNTRVWSVVNNGTSGAPVAGFTRANYAGDKVFCIPMGAKLNLPNIGTYIRSHKWTC
ncbi:peptidase inhibitor family I36 protein [Kitasatospora sp. NPDC057541]|uniref:peptidase inhibitor family I36 protein n=1 Tax=unclassified Kitasatospora TaxID=2633591 RepID=UPI0036934ABD